MSRSWIADRIEELRATLEPLEDGKVQCGERHAGGPYRDTTQERIAELRRHIEELRTILEGEH